MLASMANLKYLDDSPCFEKDRRLALAFLRGGVAVEREERAKIKKEEDNKRAEHLSNFNDMVRKAKEEAQVNPPPPRDPYRFVHIPESEFRKSAKSKVANCMTRIYFFQARERLKFQPTRQMKSIIHRKLMLMIG